MPALAKALLETDDPDRAWVLRNVLRPTAKKISAARASRSSRRRSRASPTGRGWEALLDVARDADPDAVAEALRALAQKLRKAHPDKARTRSGSSARPTAHRRRSLRCSPSPSCRGRLDTRPALARRRVAAPARPRSCATTTSREAPQGPGVDLDHLYYVGFHFTELDHPVGEELLEEVVKKGGRAKVAKMAKNKLALAPSPEEA